MQTKIFLVSILLFGSLSGCTKTKSYNQEEETKDIYKIADSRGIVLPKIPWQLINITWTYADSVIDFQRIDMDVTIDRDISNNFCLYISPFNGTLNGEQFYCGIQTRISGSPTKENLNVVTGGMKGGIFSRWSKDFVTPIGVEYVDMIKGGMCASSETEGAFCGVRYPYEWTKGTYTISLVKEETIQLKGEPHTWVSMTITDKKDGKVTKIGRLLFSGEKLYLRNNNIAFVEIYGFDENARYIPEASITFSRPKIGNDSILLRAIVAHQPVSDTRELSTNTPNCSYITSEGTDVTVHITSDVRQQSTNEIYNAIRFNGIK